jgi:hypothetical protein
MSTSFDKSYRKVSIAHGTVPLGFLISVPKALRVLLVHKIRDNRFRSLLVRWACTFIAVLGLGIWALNLLPMFLAGVIFALAICFYALKLWIGIGDILLKFALEDRSFFEMATGCQALNIFEDTEPSLPKPLDYVCGPGERRFPKFGGFAKRQFRPPLGRRFSSRPRTRLVPIQD